jgi:PAS domain S-box-containing protein
MPSIAAHRPPARGGHPPDPASLAAVFQVSLDAIWTEAPDGRLTSFNPAAETLLERDRASVIGRPAGLLFAIPDEARRIASAALRRGRPLRFETALVTRLGIPVDVWLAVSPILDADGRDLGVTVLARDVTERREIERELDRTRAELIERSATLERARELIGDMLAHILGPGEGATEPAPRSPAG